eukprot:COSAG02_NODE_687_length_18478_cov_23.093476_8_plen_471_part_00
MPVRGGRAAMLHVMSLAVVMVGAATSGDGGSPVAHWDFSGERPLIDTVHGYELRQANERDPVGIVPTSGGFERAAAFGFGTHGNRLYAPRASVPALAGISGRHAAVSVLAWVQLLPEHTLRGGAYVGGVWEEDRSWRQYAIFMDHTGGCSAKNGLVAHISAEGGPSPGQRYCESRACGATGLQPGAWHCLTNTYDGESIKGYVNGTLDAKQGHDANNPFLYPNPPKFPNGGIFTPPSGMGANFSMGANFIHDGGGVGSGHLGNEFVGLLGAFAVYNRSLEPSEITALCESKLSLPPVTERATVLTPAQHRVQRQHNPVLQRSGRGVFNVLKYGAVGDGIHNDTGAIRTALDAARMAGGGVVLLPAPHTFLSGSLHMQSHTIFRVEAGATLLGSTNYEDYPHELVPGGLGSDTRQRQSLIAGAKCHVTTLIDDKASCASWTPLVNVTLDGGGVIDGQGHAWWWASDAVCDA